MENFPVHLYLRGISLQKLIASVTFSLRHRILALISKLYQAVLRKSAKFRSWQAIPYLQGVNRDLRPFLGLLHDVDVLNGSPHAKRKMFGHHERAIAWRSEAW
jgi:hypothetical protein